MTATRGYVTAIIAGGEGHELEVVEFGLLDHWTHCTCNWSSRSYAAHHVIKAACSHAQAMKAQAEAQRLTDAQTETDGPADHPSSTPPRGDGRGSAPTDSDAPLR